MIRLFKLYSAKTLGIFPTRPIQNEQLAIEWGIFNQTNNDKATIKFNFNEINYQTTSKAGKQNKIVTKTLVFRYTGIRYLDTQEYR